VGSATFAAPEAMIKSADADFMLVRTFLMANPKTVGNRIDMKKLAQTTHQRPGQPRTNAAAMVKAVAAALNMTSRLSGRKRYIKPVPKTRPMTNA